MNQKQKEFELAKKTEEEVVGGFVLFAIFCTVMVFYQ